MIGAIIGDIVGSRFEGKYNIPVDFELFTENNRFTDDTVHTLAIAEALRQYTTTKGSSLAELATKVLQETGRRYLWCGCGDAFYKWLFKDKPLPYNSYGNGAAMRVSPCAYFAHSYEQTLEYAEVVTGITHNHPEGIRGGKAVAAAVRLAIEGEAKIDIQKRLEREFGYEFKKAKNTGNFQISCQEAVPLALSVFFEGDSFEDCIRKAVMLGGDTDTLGAITGSVAWAFCRNTKKEEEIAVKAKCLLDDNLCNMLDNACFHIAQQKRDTMT